MLDLKLSSHVKKDLYLKTGTIIQDPCQTQKS